MDGLDDFMAFRSALGTLGSSKNFCEDEREAQIERSSTTEYPYQKQYWEGDDDSDSSSNSYYDDDSSESSHDY